MAQLPQCFGFDLPDPFPCYAKDLSNFFKGPGPSIIKAEP